MGNFKSLLMLLGFSAFLCCFPKALVANEIILFDIPAESTADIPAGEMNGDSSGTVNSDSNGSHSNSTLIVGQSLSSSGFTSSEEMTKEEAKALIEELLNEARNGVPGTLEKYHALIKAMEVLSPQSNARDITRFLRRVYYSDSQLSFAGATMGEGEPNISPELAAFGNKIYVLKKWQVIPEGNGSSDKFDFGHSLVGLDAYSWSPGIGGRARGYLFTFFGDYGSQVFSWCGADGAGDWNKEDHAGNLFGRRMTNQYSDDHSLKLSEMITKASHDGAESSGATLEDFYFI